MSAGAGWVSPSPLLPANAGTQIADSGLIGENSIWAPAFAGVSG